MNFVSLASRKKRDMTNLRRLYAAGGVPWDEDLQDALYNEKLVHIYHEALAQEKIYLELRKELGFGKALGTYTLDIRPPPDVSFDNFKSFIDYFFARKPLTDYLYVYEQKGSSDETLGMGFHVHAIIKSTWRSTADIARAVQSSMDKYNIPHLPNITARCTLLQTDRDVQQKQAYMLDGTSKDGHKAETFLFDKIWRLRAKLDPKYTKGAYQDERPPQED